jgi:hypothetical protein
MLRVAILGGVVAVLAVVGCGEDSSSDQGGSRPAATATSDVRSDYYRAMDKLAVRLDRAVAGAIEGDENALARIKDVLEQIRTRLEEHREDSPGGRFLLTTAASARDYAKRGDRQGLELIRRVPLIEARDALESEASG